MNDFTTHPHTDASHAPPPPAPETVTAGPSVTQGMSHKLETLARHGRQAEQRARSLGMSAWSDDLSHLGEKRRASWRRVLSSVATTEGLEGTIMQPLMAAGSHDETTREYLEVHAADERRHHELFCGYLKSTFDYEKTKPTLSDRVFYERIFPRMAAAFRYKPLYGFALLYCYERFSVTFYSQLRSEAQTDGAQNLLTLLQLVEKDELRHIAGMEQLLRGEIRRQGGLKLGDLKAVGAILSLMILDVDMRPWALHNREVRAHLMELGVKPEEVTSNARRMRDATLELMVVTDQGVRNAAGQ